MTRLLAAPCGAAMPTQRGPSPLCRLRRRCNTICLRGRIAATRPAHRNPRCTRKHKSTPTTTRL
eukprot:1932447-Lingulodinium_polyedra.AAC.1